MVCMNKENDKISCLSYCVDILPISTSVTHTTSPVQALYFLLRLAMKTAVTRMKYALFAPKKGKLIHKGPYGVRFLSCSLNSFLMAFLFSPLGTLLA